MLMGDSLCEQPHALGSACAEPDRNALRQVNLYYDLYDLTTLAQACPSTLFFRAMVASVSKPLLESVEDLIETALQAVRRQFEADYQHSDERWSIFEKVAREILRLRRDVDGGL